MTAFAVMVKRYRKSRFDQTNYRSCGHSRGPTESITGSPKPPNLFSRTPSPRPSPHGEGITIVRLPFARGRCCHLRRTTFPEAGRTILLFPGGEGRDRRASNPYSISWPPGGVPTSSQQLG